MQSYRDLKVWQASMDLARDAYRVASVFPRDERFGLVSQVQRSAVSVSSNIAEGHARGTTREYLRFIAVALGSLAELETQLLLAERLSYVTSQATIPVLARADEVGRMLSSLRRSVKRRLST